MSRYRVSLPQLGVRLFLTDSGLETTLIFHEGVDLPAFAAFVLLRDEGGRQRIRDYYRQHAQIAIARGFGFVLEAPTWRANPDWAAQLGYDAVALDAANRDAIALMAEVRDELETASSPMVISGCIGPRGDGYQPGAQMTAVEAQAYHAAQIRSFADSEADLASAFTMNYPEEAIGIVRATQHAGIPAVISFTVETDGRLPSGHTIGAAIDLVDRETGGGPRYYMLNCAHPSHFTEALANGDTWLQRLRGLRANASRMSHAELDQAEELDDGNPVELGREHVDLLAMLPHLTVLGGCCGTDHRHVEAIGAACCGQHESRAAA